jgi:hypothetical protein
MRGGCRDASRRRLPGPIKAMQCWRVRYVPATERASLPGDARSRPGSLLIQHMRCSERGHRSPTDSAQRPSTSFRERECRLSNRAFTRQTLAFLSLMYLLNCLAPRMRMKRQFFVSARAAHSRSALKNLDEPSTLRRNGETAFAISPDNADQDLKFGIPPPHVILRSGVFAASRRMNGKSELAL